MFCSGHGRIGICSSLPSTRRAPMPPERHWEGREPSDAPAPCWESRLPPLEKNPGVSLRGWEWTASLTPVVSSTSRSSTVVHSPETLGIGFFEVRAPADDELHGVQVTPLAREKQRRAPVRCRGAGRGASVYQHLPAAPAATAAVFFIVVSFK